MENYKLEILDKNLSRIGMLPFGSYDIEIKDTLNDIGEFTLSFSDLVPVKNNILTIGSGIRLTRNNNDIFTGLIEKYETKKESKDTKSNIQITGKSYMCLFADKLCFPNPNKEIDKQDKQYDIQAENNAETLIKYYADKNVISPINSRKSHFTDFLQLGENKNLGKSIKKDDIAFQSVLEVIQEFIKMSDNDIYFNLLYKDNKLVFDVFPVKDKSNKILLDMTQN